MAQKTTDKTAVQNTQLERFQKAARDLHTDDSEEAFDRMLKTIGKPTRDPKVAGKRIGD